MLFFVLVCVVVFSCSTAPVLGQVGPASSPWDGPLFHASPEEVLKAASAVPPKSEPNITVLLDERRITLDKDQRATTTYHLVYRIENQAGVEAWSTIGTAYSPWFQKKPVLQARVVTEDKRVSTLDEKTLSDAPVHDSDGDMFDDDRVFQGPLPGLSVGCVVEEVITTEDTAPFFATGSIYREYLNRPFPVAMTRVVISAPESLPLKYKARRLPDMVAQKETKDGMVTLTFEKENLDPLDHYAPNLPSDVSPFPEIELATASSWKDIADKYREMAEPQIHPEQSAELMPKLGKDVSRQEKITAIVRALHREVRYTGLEFGEAKLTPQAPVETLKRHYGDCKDKATLLVSMLRGAGIPAYLALLNAGEGQDVDPGLPGMRLFNHAIAYVPGEKASDAGLWIDATAEYAQIGDLPSPDRGRHALIIREGTTELTTTPVSKAEDNLLVETRTFTLAENGPAQVLEHTETHGMADEIYRAEFGGAESKKGREALETYVKSVYLADKLDRIQHSDGADISKQFQLDLTVEKAKRGYSGLQDAQVAVPVGGLLYRLPPWFFTTPPDAIKTKTQKEEEDAREEAARTEDYVFEPFLNEWKYKIIPPMGFRVGELPADRKEQLGPALLEAHYSAETDGTVTAELKFNTMSGRYTAKDALALRQAIYSHRDEDAVMLRFVEGGSYELSKGHVKEALAVYRALIAAHPKESLHHTQMAMALLKAGAGEQARAEAATAVKLEPNSALALRSQCEVLSHDIVGREWEAGMDRAGAIAACKKSLEIEPDEAPTRWQLALLYEYNEQGHRYGKGSDIDAAVAQYHAATEHDKSVSHSYDESAMWDLFLAGHYQEALDAAKKLNSSERRNSVAIAATAMLSGAGDALKEAGRDAEDGTARSEALADAAQLLARKRKYAMAADLYDASVQDAKDAPQRQRQAELFRALKPYEEEMYPASDPRSAVQRFWVGMIGGEKTLDEIWAAEGMEIPGARTRELRAMGRNARSWQRYATRNGLSTENVMDERVGSSHYSVQGDDTTGYRVIVTSLGREPQTFYVVGTPAGFRVLTLSSEFAGIGFAVLGHLDANRPAAAKQWLDWAREKVKREDGDDPLAGPLMARFWNQGDDADANKMRLAAYALIAPTESAPKYLPRIQKACANASAEEATNCELMVFDALYHAHEWPGAVEAGKRLYEKYPKSDSALANYAEALAHAGRKEELLAVSAEAAKQKSEDAGTLRRLAQANAYGYEYAEAISYLKKLRDAGKLESNDYNSLAWLSLFAGQVDGDAVHAAEQANLLTKSANFSILHTLACVYAVSGKGEQARQTLLQGMDAEFMAEPNSSAWYAFGEIYEQYGLQDAAIAAYKQVEPEDNELARAEDSYVLAQRRLDALNGKNKTLRAAN